jgi:flagellar basal-body rod protein FlgF
MDALIYTAMSGAERALRGQQVHANNLANVDTGGFRANMELSTAQTVNGYGYDDRPCRSCRPTRYPPARAR